MTTTIAASSQEATDTPPVTTDELVAEFTTEFGNLVAWWLIKRVGLGPWSAPDDQEAFDKAVSNLEQRLADAVTLVASIRSLRSGRKSSQAGMVFVHDLIRAVELAEQTTAQLRKEVADRTFETCRRCGRPLQDLDSQLRGLGPECALKEMIYYP